MTSTAAARALGHSPQPAASAIARALADAFLETPSWTRPELMAAGARVLGARRRWLGPVVDEILGDLVRAPHDSPRLLATLIEDSPAFREGVSKAAARRAPQQIHYRPLAPQHPPALSHPLDPEPPLPRLRTLPELAALLDLSLGHLEWLADTKNWNRRARPGSLHHYRYEWRTRPGRVPRLLEVPEDRMRRTQRALLDQLLSRIPANDAAHGFLPGRSAVTGAARHVASDIVISFDLTTFFARVTATRIYGTLRQAGYDEQIAHVITGLCTNAVPPRVLAAMPPGGSPGERFALRRALAASHLPQGAPSSPMLANLAVRRLDSRLTGWAEKAEASYTRYADDLTFSGSGVIARRPDAFVRGVRRIIADEGHIANPAKTRVRRQGTRQAVTGIVVNQHPNLSRVEFDRLKAILHNCAVHGPAAQNRSDASDFRAHLLGRISWVESLNPGRGAKLRREFSRIDWGSP